MTLLLGRVVHALPSDTVDGFQLGDQCEGEGNSSIDRQADAVIPFRFTLTNTTSSFSLQSPSIWAEVKGQSPLVDGDVFGLQPIGCFDSKAELNATSLAPGAWVSSPGLFLLWSYYSPDAPKGNPSLYANGTIGFQYIGTQFGSWVQSDPSTGLLPWSKSVGTPVVALMPGSSPTCSAAGDC